MTDASSRRDPPSPLPAPRATVTAIRWASGAAVPVTITALAATLLAFSQTGAVFDGDEGLHLVAIQLVNAGQRPFADFFYWHEPLYLYLASTWTRIAGEGWRSLHVLSSILTAATAGVVAHLAGTALATHDRGRWSALAAVFFALNILVVTWGTMAHNYAPALFFIALAMAAALRAVEARGVGAAILSGIGAGAATAVTLLMAPLAPVMLAWIALNTPTAQRGRTLTAFVIGALVPFTPLAWLAWNAPAQTWFGLVTHHLTYRVRPTETADYQWELLSTAFTSPQVWLLGGLSLYALVTRAGATSPASRKTVSLCGWILLTLAPFVTVIHPPVHAVYLVVVAPVLAVLATSGTFGLVAHSRHRLRGSLVGAGVVLVFLSGLALWAYRARPWVSEWARIERFAAEVDRVTPPGATFYTSFPFVYVAAERVPPEGLENEWASLMAIPPEMFATLRLAPAAEIAARVRSGEFDSVLIWRGDARFPPQDLERLYAARADLDNYFVLWWNRRR